MPKIFQIFNLDLENISPSLDLSEAWKRLRRGLEAEGYGVLENFCSYDKVPTSMIVIGEFPSDQSFKSCFGEITRRLGLPFRSGEVYFEQSMNPI